MSIADPRIFAVEALVLYRGDSGDKFIYRRIAIFLIGLVAIVNIIELFIELHP